MTVKRIVVGIPTEIEVDEERCGLDCPFRWPARSRCTGFQEPPHIEGEQTVQAKGTALLWGTNSFMRCDACLAAERRSKGGR
ncbi:MAG: hypothetical protein M0R22_13135 [Dehalococcoidia bacterium]|jgi:hypothetical protein|nr:hypothetical protein [Dehalococcoidia bacterium]